MNLLSNIRVNKKAPEFKAKDFLGHKIQLNAFEGKKVMLSFFRGASCPFCNMRIRELIQSYGEFQERNIDIIAVFAATAEEIAQYAGKQEAPFPIVPDPKLDLYRLYGVESSPKGMFRVMMQPGKMMKMMFSGFFNMKALKDKPILPADFLIDEGLQVYKIYQGEDFGDHIPIQEVLDWK
ncbi:peroxiredoxin family protein [Fontibacter flavus]|uniref:thioredoxin-dependent peroxiredoxin n=1 Tax=Fontibacter flavus TaxID=654838 RepID=A0ABV6FWY4_9BACT